MSDKKDSKEVEGPSSHGEECPFLKAYIMPGVPHPLLASEQNPGWASLKTSFQKVASEIEQLAPEVLVIYSTYWSSVIGHLILARERSQWTHVDEEFHELGSITYDFLGDVELSRAYVEEAGERGLHAKPVDYEGFPIDTGSLVNIEFLAGGHKRKIVIVSSNVYSDRAETLVLGKAARSAVQKLGRKAVAIVVTSLSNRLHQSLSDPKEDQIHSLKDQEWNQKVLEFLGEGRLEDISQLSRQIHREARVHKVSNFKPFWWLSAAMGQTNQYKGEVIDYQPVYGSGAAIVSLTPGHAAAKDLEFDEDDSDFFQGERNVLSSDKEDEVSL